MGFMDTLGRIPKILESNVNALLDGLEDPEKMMDQMLVDYKRNLADVKKDTASVMADLKLAEKKLKECDEDIARKTAAAENALKAGQEEDAAKLIEAKQKAEVTRASLQENLDTCSKNAKMMQDGYNKLVSDIETLEQRRDAAKAKLSLAKGQKKLASTADKAFNNKTSETFAKYEAKAEKELAQANAAAELDAQCATTDDLTNKYASGANSTSVADEMAAMKAKLGLS